MVSDKPRVRFPPSPTGFLHVGNAHTFVFNWLFARRLGGQVVLRIEDTDELRSTPEALDAIYDGLKWLGLDWDEGPDIGGPHGPYIQSERLQIYNRYCDQLLASGRAYLCYCTKEELDQRREELRAAGMPPRLVCPCRELSDDQRAAKEAEGRRPAVNFKMAETGVTVVEDLIRGRLEFANSEMGDVVIRKSSGYPTYHFAVVVDDHLMKITHVIRGEDHISNTPRHLQIMDALGFERPQHAHLPMVLGEDRTKLSKRHGATNVADYREMGFLPDAMLNYLALLGWSPGGEEEIFSRAELIERFDLSRVGKAGSVFERGKLEYVNSEHIKRAPRESLLEQMVPIFQEQGLLEQEPSAERLEWLGRVIELMRERMRTLRELGERNRYFFTDEFDYDEKARRKWLSRPEVPGRLRALADRIETLERYDAESLEALARALAQELEIGTGQLFHPCRAAVTGCTVGPSLFHLMELLDQADVVRRLRRAADFAERLSQQS